MTLLFITWATLHPVPQFRIKGSLSDWWEIRPEGDAVLSGDTAHPHLEWGSSVGLRRCHKSPLDWHLTKPQ